MLLGSATSSPANDGWVLEPKWDGFRFLFELSPDDCVGCWTRHGKRHDGKLPYIEEQLTGLFPGGAVVDGELVALGRSSDGAVRHDFGRIGSVLGSQSPHRPSPESPALHYVVFDVLALEGQDLRNRPWSERRSVLEACFGSALANVSLTDTLEASEACHERLLEAGFEGSVYKRQNSRYLSGRRSNSWLKRKARHELEVVLGRVVRNREKVDRASCAIQHLDGQLSKVGYAEVWDPELRERLASGLDTRSRRAMVCFSSVSARGELREARLTAIL
jgi:bifunctional non-homologous end joining protein LigD